MVEEKEDIVDALGRLEKWCDEDGWYTKAQIAWEAAEEIKHLRAECVSWQNAAMRADERTEEAYDKLAKAEEPCVYEARPLHWVRNSNDRFVMADNAQTGAWCQTHGWYCPNAVGGERGATKGPNPHGLDFPSYYTE